MGTQNEDSEMNSWIVSGFAPKAKRPIFHPSFIATAQSFLCNPAEKPTNQQTDTGRKHKLGGGKYHISVGGDVFVYHQFWSPLWSTNLTGNLSNSLKVLHEPRSLFP